MLKYFYLANCDKFSEDEINIAQNQLINKTIAELTEISKNKLTAIPNIIKMINSHLANMDKNMMAEGERREKEGLPLIKEFFENIHRWVYLWGKNEALAVDFPWYLAHNSTDGKVALAKFAATTVVIDWRTELDAERRTVHPTECKDEQGGWADWKVETDKVVAVLKKLIPQLKENKADFWAHQHQRVNGPSANRFYSN